MPRRLRLVPVALAGVLLPVLLGAAAAPPPAPAGASVRLPSAGSAGIGDPSFPLDGNGGYDVAHYDVRDAYDQQSGVLRGSTAIRASALTDLSSFRLDLLLPVRSVRVDGRKASFDQPGRHELVVTPRAPLAAGSAFTVRVTYVGEPGRLSYLGEKNWLTDGVETVTMNEPHMAPWWFAANDHPRDKATFDITITGAAADTVVSNGVLVGRRPAGRGRPHQVRTHWRSVEPMATYLAFFAMGPYEVRSGTRLGLPYYTAVARDIAKPARRKAMRAMLRSPEVVRWLETYVGAYPFSTTGGLTTHLDVGFALENQTRPTYPLLGRGRLLTVVHELSHQWFGDSVSVSSWSDIWINEGLATFVEQLWTETHGGVPAQTWLERQYAALAADPSFWTLTIDDPGAAHLFDTPVYERGGMATQALRHRIGEQAFRTLLQTWVASHRGGNGSSAELEALAAQISGVDLTAFFDAWLREPRPPAHTPDNGF